MNGHTYPGEQLHHDTIDTLAEALKEFRARVGCIPAMFKVGCCVGVAAVCDQRVSCAGRCGCSVS